MSARNAQFARRALNGERLVDLAREYNVSNTRAAQIVRTWCRRQNPFEFRALYEKKQKANGYRWIGYPSLRSLRANAHQFTS